MLPIEQLRVRIGLVATDASRDAEIDMATRIAIALMEAYCDRKFAYAPDTESFVHNSGVRVSLRRYPLIHVSSITDNSGKDVKHWHEDAERGLIMFDEGLVLHRLTIHYTGGYDVTSDLNHPYVYPDDLIYAFLQIFDQSMATGTGGVTVQAGAIKAVSLVDVGRVEFTTGAEGASSGSSFAGDYLPVTASGLLESYRRHWA